MNECTNRNVENGLHTVNALRGEINRKDTSCDIPPAHHYLESSCTLLSFVSSGCCGVTVFLFLWRNQRSAERAHCCLGWSRWHGKKQNQIKQNQQEKRGGYSKLVRFRWSAGVVRFQMGTLKNSYFITTSHKIWPPSVLPTYEIAVFFVSGSPAKQLNAPKLRCRLGKWRADETRPS